MGQDDLCCGFWYAQAVHSLVYSLGVDVEQMPSILRGVEVKATVYDSLLNGVAKLLVKHMPQAGCRHIIVSVSQSLKAMWHWPLTSQ